MEFESAIEDASRDDLVAILRDLAERTTKAESLNKELAERLQAQEHITQALMKQITDITARLAQATSGAFAFGGHSLIR